MTPTKQIFYFFALLCIILCTGFEKNKYENVTNELKQLRSKGIAYKFLNDTAIAIEQEWSGVKRVKTLSAPTEEAMRLWAIQQNIPMLEIDPTTIDTAIYTGRYTYWTTVPVSNGFGFPLQVGDLDNNGKPEVYGVFRSPTQWFNSRVYEIDTSGISTLRYIYGERTGPSMQFSNVDKDALQEVIFFYGDSSKNYEQISFAALPTRANLKYGMWQIQGTAIATNFKILNLDNDSLVDFIYRGTEPDSNGIDSTSRTFVAEYNPAINNFQKVWRKKLNPIGESAIGGYDVGDYDSDGRMEILATGLWGEAWVVENTGNNEYNISWSDSIPFVNLFYQTSGDVDNDGKREFFVGATMSNGNWTTVFEADSDNHYSAKFLFHLYSGGTLDEPTYLATDVDSDEKLELVIFSGADLYVFKSDGDNSYYLWFYKWNNAKESIQFYDFNFDERKDFIISKSRPDSFNTIKLYGDIFLSTGTVGVIQDPQTNVPHTIETYSYPNPFNASTFIHFILPNKSFVTITIYDITGKQIETISSEHYESGEHRIQWKPNNEPSGVYLYRITSDDGTKLFSVVHKIVLLK